MMSFGRIRTQLKQGKRAPVTCSPERNSDEGTFVNIYVDEAISGPAALRRPSASRSDHSGRTVVSSFRYSRCYIINGIVDLMTN